MYNVSRPFLWENDQIVDLNSLIPPNSPLKLVYAFAINDRGEIPGNGIDASGNVRAFLLIPCDDNHPDVEGCDYSMVDAEVSNNAAAPQSSQAILPTADPQARTIDPSQNRFRQRYPILGQRPPAFRH